MSFREAMGPTFGIKRMLAQEIMYQNDDGDPQRYADTGQRVRGWWAS